MSDLLKAYGEAIDSRSDTLAYLTDEDKLAAAEVALSELKQYIRKYDIELKRVIKARKDAMPGFLRDVEARGRHMTFDWCCKCDTKHDLDEPCEGGVMSYNDMEVFYKIGLELDESELDELVQAVWHAQQTPNISVLSYNSLNNLRALLERARTYPKIAHIRRTR
jgi:hypothetical protein